MGVESQVEIGIEEALPVVAKRLKRFKGIVRRAKSIPDVERLIAEREKTWPEFADVLRRIVVATYAWGHVKRVRARQKLRMAGYETYEDVMDAYYDKVPVDPDVYYNLDNELRSKYWSTAVAEDEFIAARLMTLTRVATSEGMTLSTFKRQAYMMLDRSGYKLPAPYRLENIFRTNTAIADGAAREDYFAEIWDSIWGFQYVTAGDDQVRESHSALDGIRLPKDDPFWDHASPPLDFQCRCDKVEVDKPRKPIQPPGGWRDAVNYDYGFQQDPRVMLRG